MRQKIRGANIAANANESGSANDFVLFLAFTIAGHECAGVYNR